MNHEQYEKLYLLYSLKHVDLLLKTKPKFYKNKSLSELCAFARKYHSKYNHIPELPSFKKTAIKLVSNTKFKGKLTVSEVKTIFNDNVDEYDEIWLNSAIISWIQIRSFNEKLSDGIEYIKSQEITPENTKDIINRTKTIFNEVDVNFDNNEGVNFFNPESHQFNEENKITSGKKFVDRFLNGGYTTKSLICYLGEQGVGKSLFLCNDAMTYATLGKNVVYISAEMPEHSIIRRVGSMMFNVPIKKYDEWSKKPERVQNKLDELKMMGMNVGSLDVVQLANPTTIDIENYVQRYEKENDIHVDFVIVDYIGILSNYRNPNSENTYVNGKVISKDLRDAAIRNNWVVITAQQIGKGAWNSSDMSISAISESAGIAHNADLVYGIIQDEDMNLENEYWLKILKMRDGSGRNTKCKYKRNSKTLKLKETDEIKTAA